MSEWIYRMTGRKRGRPRLGIVGGDPRSQTPLFEICSLIALRRGLNGNFKERIREKSNGKMLQRGIYFHSNGKCARMILLSAFPKEDNASAENQKKLKFSQGPVGPESPAT